MDWIDVALLQLAAPVAGAPIARLYEASDEVGQQIVFVGRGRTGDGKAGPARADRLLRAATNRGKRADDGWLYFDFNAPPEGTDLEGISGPGDSGNAALASIDGVRYIMGVGSRNDHQDVGLAECVYGTTEVYARVSQHLDWIRSTLANTTGPGTPVLIDASHALPGRALGQGLFHALQRGSGMGAGQVRRGPSVHARRAAPVSVGLGPCVVESATTLGPGHTGLLRGAARQQVDRVGRNTRPLEELPLRTRG